MVLSSSTHAPSEDNGEDEDSVDIMSLSSRLPDISEVIEVLRTHNRV